MITARVGGQQVDIRGLEPLIERLSAVASPVLNRMEAYGGRLLDRARNDWPVGRRAKSGPRSRDQLGMEVVLSSSDKVALRLYSGAEYTRYIKANKLGGRNPWQVLLRKPAIDNSDELADEVRRLLDDVGNGKGAA
jgi:hypothetical protein